MSVAQKLEDRFNNSTQISGHNRSNAAGTTLLIFVLYGLISQYLLISIVAGGVLAIIINTLWKPNVPPVLPYLFVFQFVQIFGAVLYADFVGTSMDMAFNSGDIETLVIATLCQTAVMAIVASRSFVVKTIPDRRALQEAAASLDTRKILIAYGVSTMIFPLLRTLVISNPSVLQLVQSFFVIRKMFLMMLLFKVFLTDTKYKWAIIFILITEFVLSFASYFSSFKEVFLYIIMVYLTISPDIKLKSILRILPVVAILMLLLVFWSSVKVGYREFLNQGSRQQEISVGTSTALGYITDRALQYNADSMKAGGEILLRRIQYMEQYSAVYSRVPSIIPYTNGDNLGGTITFLGLPRSLVEKKAILDPSTKTSYYTGHVYANAEQGTSISMGYFCDLYIDYGLWLMTIPLIVIAYLIGKASSYIVNQRNYNIIFTYSLFIGIFLSLGTFESDIIFYLGSVRNYIVVVIIGNIFVFPWIARMIKAR